MNIQVQMCGLAILILIMCFYYGNRKVGLFTERVFSRILFISVVCLVLDILSVYVICCGDTYPALITELICKLYIVSLVWTGFNGLDYILTDMVEEKKYHKLSRIFISVTAVESLAILIAPIYVYCEGRVVYSYGLSTILTYAFTCLYIVATIVILIVRRKTFNPRRLTAMGIWMGIWFCSAVIQFVDNELLLVGFANALGVLTLFFMLENPETLLDRRYNCFNSHAFLLFTAQMYDRNEKYTVMDFYIAEAEDDTESYTNIDNALLHIVDFFEDYSEVKVFKNVENEITVFVRDEITVNNILTNFREYFELHQNKNFVEKYGEYPSLAVLIINDTKKARNLEDMVSLLGRLKNNLTAYKGMQVCYADTADIEKQHNYNEIRKEIVSALEDDRIEVFYQPIYSVEKKKIISCEALARIRRADNTLMSPNIFIPVAEDTGLITKLGERIFHKTCRFLNETDAIGMGIEYVEVNLSVTQFTQRDLAVKYMNIMKYYNVASERINLEITETASIQAKTSLLENMKKLIEFGVSFSLDDFGKGQSNLMYVVEMPVSIIKLDMDMTKAYFVEERAKHVLSATVRMAHDMGLKVVAEGIESPAELAAMENEGVDYIQGYYFSRPINEKDFLNLLLSNNYS